MDKILHPIYKILAEAKNDLSAESFDSLPIPGDFEASIALMVYESGYFAAQANAERRIRQSKPLEGTK